MSLGTSAISNPAVLTSWKEIARYMGKGVRTVQRWEQDFGLPVRRPQGSNKKAVLARPRDLDAWVALRCASRDQLGPRDSLDGAGSPNGTMPNPALDSLRAITAIRCGIETHRQLWADNRALVVEVSSALHTLRLQLQSLPIRR
jgi:hypothetical protein